MAFRYRPSARAICISCCRVFATRASSGREALATLSKLSLRSVNVKVASRPLSVPPLCPDVVFPPPLPPSLPPTLGLSRSLRAILNGSPSGRRRHFLISGLLLLPLMKDKSRYFTLNRSAPRPAHFIYLRHAESADDIDNRRGDFSSISNVASCPFRWPPSLSLSLSLSLSRARARMKFSPAI